MHKTKYSPISYSDIHSDYALYESPTSLMTLKKWYETKNSHKFILRKQTYVKCTIIIDYLTDSPRLRCKFNNKIKDFINTTIKGLSPFKFNNLSDFEAYVKLVQYNKCLYDPYVETIFDVIYTMSIFRRWLQASHYRIRMR